MKKYLFVHFILSSLFIILNSCKKNSTNYNQNQNLLAKQSWIVVSIRHNINNSGWIDIFSALPTCQKDNMTFFNTGYSVNIDEGLTKCNASDPQSNYYGTWLLSSDGKKITTTSNSGISSEMDVQLLDNSNFVTLKNYFSGTDTEMLETKYTH